MNRGAYFIRKSYQELQRELMSVFDESPYNRPGYPKRTYNDIHY